MKKKDIESYYNAVERDELAALGFEWTKYASHSGRSWVRRDAHRGVTQVITPVVTVFGPSSASVAYNFLFVIDALQDLEVSWTSEAIYKEMSPLVGTVPVTLGSTALKQLPGGSSLVLASEADLVVSADQARRIVRATVAWLERFSDLASLRNFLEKASDQELLVASIFPLRQESLLLQIYFLAGEAAKVVELARRILARPEEPSPPQRAIRARATVALARASKPS